MAYNGLERGVHVPAVVTLLRPIDTQRLPKLVGQNGSTPGIADPRARRPVWHNPGVDKQLYCTAYNSQLAMKQRPRGLPSVAMKPTDNGILCGQQRL